MPVENIDNSSVLANNLYNTLTSGLVIPTIPNWDDTKYSFDVDPASDLYTDITSVSIADVTENDLNGNGAFDVFMSVMDKHLDKQFKDNRITGKEYAEVYVNVTQQVLSQAVQFALSKDRTKWEAVTAQMQARISEIQATQSIIDLERTKIEAATSAFQMSTIGAQYALTKMQVATEEANHNSVTYDAAIKEYQLKNMMPKELQLTDENILKIQADVDQVRENILLTVEQKELTKEQAQTERANTLEDRVDGTPIAGVISLQKRNLESDADIKDYQVNTSMPADVAIKTIDAAIKTYENQVLQPLEADLQIQQRDLVIPVGVNIEEYKLNELMPLEKSVETYKLDEIMPIEKSIQEYELMQRMPYSVELMKEQINVERGKTLDTRRDGITPISGSMGFEQRILQTQADMEQYKFDNLLPKELESMTSQINLVNEQIETERANTLDTRSDGITAVSGLIELQKLNLQKDSDIKNYNLVTKMPKEIETMDVQINLVQEQVETERANTLDTRTDGTTLVGGLIKLQKLNLQKDSDIKDYNLNTTLPKETESIDAQINLTNEQIETERANTQDTRTDGITPVSGIIELQKLNLQKDSDIKNYNLSNTLPKELENIDAQITLVQEQVETERANTLDTRSDGVTPVSGIIKLQKLNLQKDSDIKDYNLTNMMPKELDNINAQIAYVEEQIETERANTMDTRTDGTVTSGIIKLQKLNLQKDSDIKDYNLTNTLPKELENIDAQISLVQEQVETERANTLNTRSDGTTAVSGIIELQKLNLQKDADMKDYNITNRLPKEIDLIDSQIAVSNEQIEAERSKTLNTRTDGTVIAGTVGLQNRNLTADADLKDYQLSDVLPAQVFLTDEQSKLTSEQKESERAKTLNVRTGFQTVEGLIGKQKELYTQQIDSFIKDAEHKTAKMYLDGWITQKTLDEGLLAPTQLTNNNIDAVLAGVRTSNGL